MGTPALSHIIPNRGSDYGDSNGLLTAAAAGTELLNGPPASSLPVFGRWLFLFQIGAESAMDFELVTTGSGDPYLVSLPAAGQLEFMATDAALTLAALAAYSCVNKTAFAAGIRCAVRLKAWFQGPYP